MKNRDAVFLRHLLDAGADRLCDRIARALSKDCERLGIGMGCERQRSEHGGEVSTRTFHHIAPSRFLAGFIHQTVLGVAPDASNYFCPIAFRAASITSCGVWNICSTMACK